MRLAGQARIDRGRQRHSSRQLRRAAAPLGTDDGGRRDAARGPRLPARAGVRPGGLRFRHAGYERSGAGPARRRPGSRPGHAHHPVRRRRDVESRCSKVSDDPPFHAFLPKPTRSDSLREVIGRLLSGAAAPLVRRTATRHRHHTGETTSAADTAGRGQRRQSEGRRRAAEADGVPPGCGRERIGSADRGAPPDLRRDPDGRADAGNGRPGGVAADHRGVRGGSGRV